MIVIPAHNEAASIAQVVARARRLALGPVVVVDDCSSDDTARLAQESGATVLRLPLQLGAWGATQTGLRFAERAGWPLAVTMDADGQHEADEIPALMGPLQRGEADVVIGACPARVSAMRRTAWAFFKRLSGVSLEDLTSGFRAYNRDAIELLSSRLATLLDYQDLGVLLVVQNQGLRVIEVPVMMQPRGHGKSHVFDSWWTVLRYLMLTGILSLARVGRC